MVEGRRLAYVAMVALMVLGSSSGCDDEDSGRPSGRDKPRDSEIRETIDAAWKAVGVDRDLVYVAAYGFTFAPDNAACADVPRDDRWYGERGSHIPAGHVDQAAAEAAIVDHLESAGFTVRRYRSTHPDSPLRAYSAIRGDLTVDGVLTGDGGVSVNVRSGPCARTSTAPDPRLYEPAD